MITSDDLQKIKDTIDCLSFLSQISENSLYIDFNQTSIVNQKIEDLNSYYKKIYTILTTSGMSYQDYKDSLENS